IDSAPSDGPGRFMIYLEDIIELIEDVPDELQRRGGLIQDWERQASEYKREADKLTARLNNESSNLRDDEKAHIFWQIAEMLKLAREVTQKKADMAAKCHRLVQALSERVSEYSYHCKLELEVDAPGCTASIESAFVQETMMMRAAAANSARGGGGAEGGGEFRVPEERLQQQHLIRDWMGSSSISRESTPYGGGRGGGGGAAMTTNYGKRTRDSSMTSSRASSAQPFDLQQGAGLLQQRKRKRDRQRERQPIQRYEPTPPSPPSSRQLQHLQQRGALLQQLGPKEPSSSSTKMSSYMRKKKEREREQRKLREVHANRERSSQQRVIKPEPYDDGYETQPAPASQRGRIGRPPGSRTAAGSTPLHHHTATLPVRREEMMMPERREEQPQPEDIFAGGMSDADDDDLLKFLNDEMPGGIADHDDLNLGLEDENLFDMASFGADLGKALEKIQKERPPSPLGQNIYGTLNAPTKSSAAGSSRYTNKKPSKADKKRHQAQPRQYVTFGAGESMHGRQRRMTPRADIFSHDLETREKRRRQKEEEVAHGEYSGYGRESRDVSLVDDMYGTAAQEDESDNTPYCYCHKPSEGVMVGCEGENCPHGGWFHLECLDMDAPPAVDKWYCNECQLQRGGRGSGAGGHYGVMRTSRFGPLL
ncbi:hypothetical protein PENTCL1PPCAC_5449, partial [Pristionchus entomophagus]